MCYMYNMYDTCHSYCGYMRPFYLYWMFQQMFRPKSQTFSRRTTSQTSNYPNWYNNMGLTLSSSGQQETRARLAVSSTGNIQGLTGAQNPFYLLDSVMAKQNPFATNSGTVQQNPLVSTNSGTAKQNPFGTTNNATLKQNSTVTADSTTVKQNQTVTTDSATVKQNSSVTTDSATTKQKPVTTTDSAAVKQNSAVTKKSKTGKQNSTATTKVKSSNTNPQIIIQEVNDGKTMPYVLIAPKDVKPGEKLPVIMHLHGRGQVGKSLKDLQTHQYDPAVIMNKWNLKNFRGYIICPLLKSGSWNTKKSENQIRNLYNNFASTHNIDQNKVAVTGASLGAQGALYMANAMSDVFKKAVAFSPYNPGNLGGRMKIPTKVFVGSKDDPNSIKFTNNKLKNTANVSCQVLNGTNHDGCTGTALNLDANNNGASDVIEWLFA